MFEKMYKKVEDDKLDIIVCRFHKLLEKENGNFEEESPKYFIPYFKNTSFKDRPSSLIGNKFGALE